LGGHRFSGRLKIEEDALAKSHIPVARLAPRHYVIADKPWSIWFQGRKIAKIEEEIYDIVHAPGARNYWEDKGKTLNHNIDYIHWSAIGKAMQGLPRQKQWFIIKQTVRMCGVGK
jgi:hypothetical protein